MVPVPYLLPLLSSEVELNWLRYSPEIRDHCGRFTLSTEPDFASWLRGQRE